MSYLPALCVLDLHLTSGVIAPLDWDLRGSGI